MMSVTRVGSEFYGNGTYSVKPFQKLRILVFANMLKWEEWSSSGCVDNDGFPKLEELRIMQCPNLCGNLPKHLPSLHDLYIEGCSELTTRIPQEASPRSMKLKGCKNIAFEDMSSLNFLRSLEMRDFQSNSFPSGMTENCINLEELRIDSWFTLTHFPNDGLPTTLRKLKILYCNNLLEFLPKETFHNYKYLENLDLFDSCDSMTSFSLGLFPNLKYLYIFKCKNLKSFFIEDGDHENLKSLLSLTIEDCGKLINFLGGELRTPNLISLRISKCKNLESLPEGMNNQLPSLRYLKIEDCDKLINFPRGGLWTPGLKLLRIWRCKNLKSLPEGINTQLPSLEDLSIHNCEEVDSFPSGGFLLPNLRDLGIDGCKKLMAKMRELDLHTLSSLRKLTIGDCEEIETFPEAE